MNEAKGFTQKQKNKWDLSFMTFLNEKLLKKIDQSESSGKIREPDWDTFLLFQ